MVEPSFSAMEVMGTGDVAKVSDLRPAEGLGVGVEGVGRQKFSFPGGI